MPLFEMLGLDSEASKAALDAQTLFHRRYAEQLLQARDALEREPGFIDEQADGYSVVAAADVMTFNAIVARSFMRAAEIELVLGQMAFSSLRSAGRHYRLAGLPYGLLLETMTSPDRGHEILSEPGLVDTLRALAPQITEEPRPGPVDDTGPYIGHEPSLQTRGVPERGLRFAGDALAHPIQQSYLILAFLGDPRSAVEHRNQIAAVLERLSVHGALPVGAQSAPLAIYLAVARGVLEGTNGNVEARASMVSAFRTLGQAQAANIELARQDHYHWERILSPTVLVDIDQVLFAAMMARATGDLKVLQSFGTTGSAGLAAIAFLEHANQWPGGLGGPRSA